MVVDIVVASDVVVVIAVVVVGAVAVVHRPLPTPIAASRILARRCLLWFVGVLIFFVVVDVGGRDVVIVVVVVTLLLSWSLLLSSVPFVVVMTRQCLYSADGIVLLLRSSSLW